MRITPLPCDRRGSRRKRVEEDEQTDEQNDAGHRAGIEDAVVVLGNRKRPAEIGFGDGLEDHGERERRLGKVALDHQVADRSEDGHDSRSKVELLTA